MKDLQDFTTLKARKRIKSKLGIDALDEFFVMKELVINPLLTTETNADSIYSPNDGPLKLREHMRAGHYKVYYQKNQDLVFITKTILEDFGTSLQLLLRTVTKV